MLFTQHDRFLTLIRWVSFLMLPGSIFSVFHATAGSSGRGWPGGGCGFWPSWLVRYAMQAGSDVNDGFAVIYALASVDFCS